MTNIDTLNSGQRKAAEGFYNFLFGSDKELFKACTWLSGVVWESIGEVVVAARDTQCNRQFGVVVAQLDLPRPEQLELQAAPDPSLVDVGEQGIHFGAAGQLALQLGHVAAHLFELGLQRL